MLKFLVNLVSCRTNYGIFPGEITEREDGVKYGRLVRKMGCWHLWIFFFFVSILWIHIIFCFYGCCLLRINNFGSRLPFGIQCKIRVEKKKPVENCWSTSCCTIIQLHHKQDKQKHFKMTFNLLNFYIKTAQFDRHTVLTFTIWMIW